VTYRPLIVNSTRRFVSVQQPHLEVVFKLPNLMPQGRLRESQSCGGLAEMQGFSNGHEIP
jgi:hypothetical protein